MADKKPGYIALIKYGLKNLNYIRAMKARDRARVPIFFANVEIGKLDVNDPTYASRIEEYDEAVIEYYKGKFLASKASQTGDGSLWGDVFGAFKRGGDAGKRLLGKMKSGSPGNIMRRTGITSEGTEIKFAGSVPLVPEITPVIMLKGSDFEMGRQFAKQLVQIYGRWILERKLRRGYTERQRETMGRWMKEHDAHTPWLRAFIDGWVQGANESGVPMKVEDVASLWVGDREPASDFLSQDGLPQIPPMACSGMAAWGRATPDGKLVTGSTGDHDLSYQVIIAAYPDDGNPFIYSAFGATGDIAGAGNVWFFGHPAMNAKGLAYVHHGGGPKFLEPKALWGYGVRRAASVMHILRYSDSARQAKDMEMSMPIGDIGNGDQATVGGFYADDSYGYVIEGRKDPFAIREAGALGETDFLYANNSVCHPDAIRSEWMRASEDEWRWDPHGGWRPKRDVGSTKSLALFFQWAGGSLSTNDVLLRGLMMSYTNSCYRNIYMHRHLDAAKGRVTPEYMKAMYRNGGRLPEGPWDEVVANYKKTGDWGEVSTGHASNALTVVMKPSEGLFSVCTGPAKRGLKPLLPGSILPIYGETNVFYDLRLGETPGKMRDDARDVAEGRIEEAAARLSGANLNLSTRKLLEGYLSEGREQYARGEKNGEDPSIYSIAAATRCYTRAQVRAQQVIEAINPPPSLTG